MHELKFIRLRMADPCVVKICACVFERQREREGWREEVGGQRECCTIRLAMLEMIDLLWYQCTSSCLERLRLQ